MNAERCSRFGKELKLEQTGGRDDVMEGVDVSRIHVGCEQPLAPAEGVPRLVVPTPHLHTKLSTTHRHDYILFLCML
jgi:hypothetical protein